VAGSLLHAIGLPELIASSLAGYEQLALNLVGNPDYLASIKARLLDNRKAFPLFDTGLMCRNIEACYIAMWRQSQLGDARDELS
jgi:predicted O-linked N-acetylglucosamine transferase (SPINDLY family)